jgi:hypothetical protein
MLNQTQSPKDKKLDFNDRGVVLAFKHLDFNCHLDFDIWNLLRQLQKSGKRRGGLCETRKNTVKYLN